MVNDPEWLWEVAQCGGWDLVLWRTQFSSLQLTFSIPFRSHFCPGRCGIGHILLMNRQLWKGKKLPGMVTHLWFQHLGGGNRRGWTGSQHGLPCSKQIKQNCKNLFNGTRYICGSQSHPSCLRSGPLENQMNSTVVQVKVVHTAKVQVHI